MADRQTVAASLRGAPVVVLPDGSVSVPTFERFAVDIVARSALNAVALEEVVDGGGRQAFEDRTGVTIRDRGADGFVPAAVRDRYCPVAAVWPSTAETQAVLGLDVCADQTGPTPSPRRCERPRHVEADPRRGRSVGNVHGAASTAQHEPHAGDVVGFVTFGYLADDLLQPLEATRRRGPRSGCRTMAPRWAPPTTPDRRRRSTLGRTWTIGAADGRSASPMSARSSY
jgi:hypothetical protein